MITKRIIPCLDVQGGRVVKGKQFVALKDAGDPVLLAQRYEAEGADELVFLDITATSEKRSALLSLVEKVASSLFIPFSVGGGITTLQEIRELLAAGADKVSLNTAAVLDPSFLQRAADMFGSQCLILAIDAKQTNERWQVMTHGGEQVSHWSVVKWALEGARLGAGEILLTSIDCDGSTEGFDVPLLKIVSEAVTIPIIASGGAGTEEHFSTLFQRTTVDAALAASIFHFGQVAINDLKMYLKQKGISIR